MPSPNSPRSSARASPSFVAPDQMSDSLADILLAPDALCQRKFGPMQLFR